MIKNPLKSCFFPVGHLIFARMHNSRNPAVKRLMREAKDLATPTELYYAQPLEDNLFEWHFTIRGPVDSDFEGGVYHGRVLIPGDYPMKPPNIILLTPNGRFEINKKICLSISGYHPETWRPAWSIRTALLALIGFMPTHGLGAIGALEYPPEERRRLARQSRDWRCPVCCAGDTASLESLLCPLSDASAKETEEARSLAKEITIAGEKPKEAEQPEQQQQELKRSAASSPIIADLPTRRMPCQPLSQPVQPLALQPPMSFQEWLVKIKGYSEARAGQLVQSADQSRQQQQQQQQQQQPANRAHSGYSIIREEWTTIVGMVVLALAIALLLARRALLLNSSDAGSGYDNTDANSW